MSTTKLEPAQWEAYFRRFSKERMHSSRIDYAEIRVFSPEIGAQKETSWLPLRGITYDPRDNILEVDVKGLDHLVYEPREIFVDEVEGVLASMEIRHPDGTAEVIEVR